MQIVLRCVLQTPSSSSSSPSVSSSSSSSSSPHVSTTQTAQVKHGKNSAARTCAAVNTKPLLPEWGLIELQGAIARSGSRYHAANFQGLRLGTLVVTSKGCPILHIGNHRLEGKVIKLKKPFIVCRSASKCLKPVILSNELQHKRNPSYDNEDISRPTKKLKLSNDTNPHQHQHEHATLSGSLSATTNSKASNHGSIAVATGRSRTTLTMNNNAAARVRSSINDTDGTLDVLGVVRYKYLFKTRPRLVSTAHRNMDASL